MNPRVSRSSALASKATGFPIAKIAAKLAIGYTLDEIPNDITRETPASFEPTLDYVVVKVPRFAFEKFPEADPTLTTHDEERRRGDGDRPQLHRGAAEGAALASRRTEAAVLVAGEPRRRRRRRAAGRRCRVPADGRLDEVQRALRAGATVEQVHEATDIDPWFLDQIALINEVADELRGAARAQPGRAPARQAARVLRRADRCAARAAPRTVVRGVRHALGVRPVYKTVDTCAAEFAAITPYHYSTYDEETEVRAAASGRR